MMSFLRLLCAVWIVFSYTGLALAASMDEAIKAYDNKKYAQALMTFMLPENQNNLEALFAIGDAYRNGNGIKQSDKLAAEYWKKAADQGHPNSQVFLAQMYLEGAGVPQSYDNFYKYAKMAEARGNTLAKVSLGGAYYHGLGRTPAYELSRVYLEDAYRAGEMDATSFLGLLYENGLGGPKMIEEAAFMYAQNYRSSRHKEALKKLQSLAKSGSEYAKFAALDVDLSERADLHALHIKMVNLADNGNVYAQCQAGVNFRTGFATKQDKQRGNSYYALANKRNNLCSLYFTGLTYEPYTRSNSGQNDYEGALRVYRQGKEIAENLSFNSPENPGDYLGKFIDAIERVEAAQARIERNRRIAAENERIRIANAAAEAEADRQRRIQEIMERENRQPAYNSEDMWRSVSPFRTDGTYKTCRTENGKTTCY